MSLTILSVPLAQTPLEIWHSEADFEASRVYLPPLAFLCCIVQLLVVCGAKQHHEVIANLDPQTPWLSISHAVRMRG